MKGTLSPISQLVFITAMLLGAVFLPNTSLADGRVITNIDGLSLNPSAIGANFISDTGYNHSSTDPLNNCVYQAAGKMEFVLRVEFHFSYGVPSGCSLAGETLEVLAVDFVTASTQHAYVSTVDPTTASFTTNGNTAEIRFPFDLYDPANGNGIVPRTHYEIVPRVTLRGTATYGNTQHDFDCAPLSPASTATLETGLVLFPAKYMETEIDEQARMVTVKLSSYSLVASDGNLGAAVTQKPVIGEVIRPSSAGGKMIFSPSQAATEEYWGGGSLAWYGLARFNYYTPEQFVLVPAVDPPLPDDLDNPIDPSASTADISDNVATAFGPMGFLAKAAAGTTMKYVLNKALDYPAPLPSPLRLKVPNVWAGGVDSSGNQNSYLLEGYMRSDGSVKVAGRAGSVVAKSSGAAAIIPSGTQVIFDPSTMLPGAPQRIANLPSGGLLPIEIKPAIGFIVRLQPRMVLPCAILSAAIPECILILRRCRGDIII
jgi:hypothetical protein